MISEELVRDGYEFARWNDMANGSGRSYVEGQTITFYRESLELIL